MNSTHHDEELHLDIRTLPKVSSAIIILCILIHFFTAGSVDKKEAELRKKIYETESFYHANPKLTVDPEIQKMFFSQKVEDVGERLKGK
jgi:hypothetical protein